MDKNNECEYYGEEDLSRLEKKERLLSITPEKLLAAIDSLTELVAYQDMERKVLFANRATADAFGLKPEDITGKICYEVFHNADRPCDECPVEKARKTGDIHKKDMISQDGRHWIIKGIPVKDENDFVTGVIEITSDITEYKKSDEVRKKIDEKMQYLQKLDSLSKMAGGIAHDFNNILAIILSSADLSLMDVAPDSSIYENLELIMEACDRAKKLTDQMLAFTGRVVSEHKPFNINNLIMEMKQLIEASISKKIILKVDLHPHLKNIDGDVSQIGQLFMNIISNASEAINDSPGTITITTGTRNCTEEYLSDIWIDKQLPEGEYVFLEVADTGCGMSEDTKIKIFDPFFSTKFTGRGLGLAVVLGIAKKHNGAIKVNSKDGKYTIVTVLFPVAGSSQDYKTKEAMVFNGAFSGTILLVDDEKDYLNLGKRFLEKIGFNVLTAENGRDALNVFRDNCDEIRCVLLDLTMPELNGLQTFSGMKSIKNDVPVIILSGYNEENVLNLFKDKHISAFIQKPYKLRTLSDKIKEII